MAINVSVNQPQTCPRCGTQITGGRANAFLSSFAELYKGTGKMPFCRDCVREIYGRYLADCEDKAAAVRQVCRKLDIYWNEDAFEAVDKRSSDRGLIVQYIQEMNKQKFVGKCYDDTLSEEGRLWWFQNLPSVTNDESDLEVDPPVDYDVPSDVRDYWGSGYDNQTCLQLEDRKRFYIKQYSDAFPENMDAGSDTLLRQICVLDVSNANDIANGKNPANGVKTLADLLGSLALKPDQKKENDSSLEKTPFGVWIKKFEDEEPIIDPDEEMSDSYTVIRFIQIWVFGHLCKMFKIKNAYSRLYDEEIAKLRVEHPEYMDEDDNEFLSDVYEEDLTEEESSQMDEDGDADDEA